MNDYTCKECGRFVLHTLECSVTRQSFEANGDLKTYYQLLAEYKVRGIVERILKGEESE